MSGKRNILTVVLCPAVGLFGHVKRSIRAELSAMTRIWCDFRETLHTSIVSLSLSPVQTQTKQRVEGWLAPNKRARSTRSVPPNRRFTSDAAWQHGHMRRRRCPDLCVEQVIDTIHRFRLIHNTSNQCQIHTTCQSPPYEIIIYPPVGLAISPRIDRWRIQSDFVTTLSIIQPLFLNFFSEQIQQIDGLRRASCEHNRSPLIPINQKRFAFNSQTTSYA